MSPKSNTVPTEPVEVEESPYPRADLATPKEAQVKRYELFADYIEDQCGLVVDPVHLRAAMILRPGFTTSDVSKGFREQRRAEREAHKEGSAERKAAAAAKRAERDAKKVERLNKMIAEARKAGLEIPGVTLEPVEGETEGSENVKVLNPSRKGGKPKPEADGPF